MKNLTLLCAHKPSLDPRIAWVANTAAKYFNVTVVGICPDAEDTPQGKYTVKLLPYRSHSELMKLLRQENRSAARHETLRSLPHTLAMLPSRVIQFATRAWQSLRYRTWRRQAEWQKKRGIEPPPFEERLAGDKKSLYVKLCEFDSVWAHFRAAWLNYRYFYFEKAQDAPDDLILCADLDTLQTGAWYKKKYGAKLFYDAHEFFAYAFPDCSFMLTRFCLRQERTYIRKTDFACTVNPFLARIMMKELKFDRLLSVPNCAPLEPVRGYQDEMNEIAAGRVKFLFQGNFMPERGLEELLLAWTTTGANAALFLRGLDSPSKAALEKKAEELGVLGKNVYFLPPVTEEDLIPAARSADVCIIPYKGPLINYLYACPNKLSQYMQAERAILANGTVYVRDRIETYHCGLIYDCNEPQTIVAAVKMLCDDEALRRALGENGRKMAQEDYNWAIQCQVMEDAFRQYA